MTNRPFRFGVVAAQARTGDEWITKACRAEALGYATFLIPDTLGQTLAPLPALTAAASATATLRVGTFVLANDFRNPVLLARECATLDFLSGGRFELGLGAGRPTAEGDYRKLGLPFASGGTRVERLAEALGIIKALLNGQQVHTAGPHYAAAGADGFPPIVRQPGPPILIAASGKRLLTLAAREADIVSLAAPPNTGTDVLAEKVGWLRQAAGKRFVHLELNTNLIAVLPDSQAGQPADNPYLARLGLDVGQLICNRSPFVLAGSTDEMCAQLQARRESLGISYITCPDSCMETLAPVVERLAGR
ncbi:MAG: TIGR03621 family F420-dependent LLM class oxidoreductase [Thermomicrobiales bacterium]